MPPERAAWQRRGSVQAVGAEVGGPVRGPVACGHETSPNNFVQPVDTATAAPRR